MKNKKNYPVYLDFIPLILFFLVNKYYGFMNATIVLIFVSVFVFMLSYFIMNRVAIVPLVSTILAVIFGSLTVFLDNPNFIKFKVSLLNVMFGIAILIGILFKKNVMKLVLGHSLEIKEKGWRILSYMWIGFFLTLAAVNEVVWRNVSTEAWVNFKVFGVLAITFVFVLCNMPIILKYKEDNKE